MPYFQCFLIGYSPPVSPKTRLLTQLEAVELAGDEGREGSGAVGEWEKLHQAQ
jgi:hypothetical protein